LKFLNTPHLERRHIDANLADLVCQASGHSLRNRKVVLNVPASCIAHQWSSYRIVPRANLVETMDQRLGHPFIANHGSFEHRLVEAVVPLAMAGLELLKN